jgi:4'-phosphopantetheinyl transferase
MKLAPDDVHVWRIDLDDARWDCMEWVLDSDERIKAMQFRSDQLQGRSRRCRSALRCLLAGYTGETPSTLAFSEGRFGKPRLEGERLHFNVSHSDGWALIAVARTPVGVDIEPAVRPDIELLEIADLLCHPNEMAALQTHAGEAQHAAMMRLWTRKEAYVKALGTGLGHRLRAVRLLPAARPANALVIDDDDRVMNGYFLYDVEVPPRYVANVCIASPSAVVTLRDRDCGTDFQNGATGVRPAARANDAQYFPG